MVNDLYRAISGKVREGSKAPMFTATDVRGEKFDTRAYLGRSNLVIFFYRNYLCSTCQGELKDLKHEYDRIAQQGAEVVAISTDSLDEAKDMAVNLQLPFKVISDPDHKIIDEYEVYDSENGTAFITLYVVDRTGTVRFKKSIEGLDSMFSARDLAKKLKDLGTAF